MIFHCPLQYLFLPEHSYHCQHNAVSVLAKQELITQASFSSENKDLVLTTGTRKNPHSPQMQLSASKPSQFFVLSPRIFPSCHIIRLFFQLLSEVLPSITRT